MSRVEETFYTAQKIFFFLFFCFVFFFLRMRCGCGCECSFTLYWGAFWRFYTWPFALAYVEFDHKAAFFPFKRFFENFRSLLSFSKRRRNKVLLHHEIREMG